MPVNHLLRLLDEQQTLRPKSAIEQFSAWHDGEHGGASNYDLQTAGTCAVPYQERYYKDLIPTGLPNKGEQFSFEVNLDACTGCKACVAACHSLNGLDEAESWRDIGQLVGDATAGAAWQQTVTTACHHCVEPGCLQGCPTLAYDKDPITGIVSHLDDQCIGCQYCSLKCPYDVPKFNSRLGIVRKCDMCHQRLKAGEAPACVQACPNGAIAIRIVDQAQMALRSEPVIEGAFRSDYTQPTTSYVSAKPRPQSAHAPNFDKPREEHSHWPLVVMLVLTQMAAGACVAQVFRPSVALGLTAAAIGMVGIHASILHLGQPLKAWKAVLGWRRSWLSREVIVFGAFAGALTALAMTTVPAAWLPKFVPSFASDLLAKLAPFAPLAAVGASAAGLLGVFCSVMVYVDTRRAGWSLRWTLLRFVGTTAVLGGGLAAAFAPASNLRFAVALLVAVKLVAEARMLAQFLRGPVGESNRLTAKAAWGPLKQITGFRFVLGLFGALAILGAPAVGLALLVAAELLERTLFFRAQHAPRMPGVVS